MAVALRILNTSPMYPSDKSEVQQTRRKHQRQNRQYYILPGRRPNPLPEGVAGAANRLRGAQAKQETNSGRFRVVQHDAAKALCRGHQNPQNLAIRDAMRSPVSVNLEGWMGVSATRGRSCR
jgi:hypothetical protein